MSVSSDGSVLQSLADLDEYTLRLASLGSAEDRFGTLWKRGRGKRYSFIRPWAKREFVLDAKGKKLDYKAPAGDANGDTRGTLILDANSSVKPLSASNSKFPSGASFGFEILTSQDSLELACEDEATQRSWITALQLTIQQDIISEAKIQKKIYDDHCRRKAEKEKKIEAKKEKEAEDLLTKAMLAKTHSKVLEKQASSVGGVKEKEEPHIPSRDSLEADALLMGAVESAKSGHHGAVSKDGNTTVILSVDLDKMQEEVTAQQLAQSKREGEQARKQAELNRIHAQMKDRQMKANELRRKHQVRQNFRAAVKRAIIQHKFVTQLHDDAQASATRNWHTGKPTKYDSTKILFEQGENSDSARGIEKMLEKKKLERQMQLKLMCPPPPSVSVSYSTRAESDSDAIPPPPPRPLSETIPPPPAPPTIPKAPDGTSASPFVSLPEDGRERESDVIGPPSMSLLRRMSSEAPPP
eukprot:CAMPEP_0197552450 /NCGR_PEP_ID=MMETSP1320-20131121/5926_1 /TAXON_ID=91990 /ORGANISM="Bolidomonas sp., Strain RCC2347" /LENGTH=468 /DNA_ID=CAMNT_0043113029 /DNA_START=244 /DNA_END=1646 /DNA_ORIENTATION=+